MNIEGLVEQLNEQIDGTVFRTVRLYLQDKASDVRFALVVEKTHDLAVVAAQIYRPAYLDGLIAQGVVKFIVPSVRTNADYHIQIDSISDDRHCRVLLCPPCYIIQF